MVHVKQIIHFSDLNQIFRSVSSLLWKGGIKIHIWVEVGACLIFCSWLWLLEPIPLPQWAAARSGVSGSPKMGLQSRIHIWGSWKCNCENQHKPTGPEPKGNWPKINSNFASSIGSIITSIFRQQKARKEPVCAMSQEVYPGPVALIMYYLI